MISKQDIKIMPFTFIVAPVLLISMSFILIVTYNEMIEEKTYIVNLGCSELRDYTQIQQIESKFYNGHDVYLKFAQDRYHNLC